MLNTGRAVQALVAQVSELTTQVQLLRSPAAPPTPPSFSIPGNHSPQHEPRLPAPEKYAGDPNLCRAFLTKCSLFFSLQPLTFATEVSRVALVLDVVELPLGLDELVDLALRVDARLQQRDLRGRRKLTPRYPFFDTGDTVGHSSVDEPMQVGRARLSREERDCQRMRGLCLYCGAAGHFLASCPVKDQARQ